uniref:FIG005666: putative helicase n=1 Tax=uncultured Thiotrichaceae bacterium TaxID=298394 RepID=A0A6S6TYV6_9GAMM|nr:MAG: FIG005666: putative helicase [uncultured Thiotrichaceae bacterium]
MPLKTILNDLRQFVEDEQKANYEQLFEVWEKPIRHKLKSGESQHIKTIKRTDKNYLTLTLGDNESRLREGDMICLHLSDPMEKRHINQATIEAEYENEWLVRVHIANNESLEALANGCYADPDTMDLKAFYDKALDEVAVSRIGREVVLPLLADQLQTGFIFEDNYDDAADRAEAAGLNEQKIYAISKSFAAKYLDCIQNPPGTGKTKVISLIAKLLVEEGHRVLITSHTHMAINNTLNKIAGEQVPLVKVGARGCTKGLDNVIPHVEYGSYWKDQPESGYVIGATPFATCSARLENYQFNTVIFDEASQVTLPLAVMAMRKAKRFVFVGDHKQLPPVVLSASVLSDYSIFSRLISGNQDVSVMLNQTYRMCRSLSHWPSEHYYQGELVSAGLNADRCFSLLNTPGKYVDVLSEAHPFVFIQSPGLNTKYINRAEAQLVVDIIENAISSGLDAAEIGVVTPFRSHAKALKTRLINRGLFSSAPIVMDTVERMQGQEREMIIISLCASDPQYLEAIAGFFFQAERLNVAITRPKTKLILIGPVLSENFANHCDDAVLQKSIDDYRSLISSAYQIQRAD